MNWLKEALALAVFEFWLISFPMGGNLLYASSNLDLLFFLLPHTITLFIIANAIKPSVFKKISKVSVLLIILLTISFPFAGAYQKVFLIFIGIAGAFMVIRTLGILNNSSDPVISAGIGLALGNGLVFIQSNMPFDIAENFYIIGFSLIPLIFLSQKESYGNDANEMKKHLPFIYVFYLIGGLFYGFIMPEYSQSAIASGVELLFYIPTAIAAVLIIRKDRELSLAAGIFCGMLAFSLFKSENILLIQLSMFSSQASFALVDVYLLCLLVSSGGSIRIFGYGIGTLCSAIISGRLISDYMGNVAEPLVSAGNIILTLAILIFYFSGKKQSERQLKSVNIVSNETNAISPVENDFAERFENLMDSFHKKFSDKERIVLNLAMQGKTYKEIAIALNISESSVKTYMKRVYEKMGVQGKESLIRMLSNRNA